MSRPALGAALAILASATLAACSKPVADNLLFITMDTTRADHLSLYGYDHPTSPELERIARRGTVFESAHSHVASTLPAHSSMMTGQLPPTHGVRCNGVLRLPETATTLAERLRAAGFSTAAVVGAFPLERRFGLAQGFQVYDDDFASSELTARRRGASMDKQGRWLGHDYPDFERSGFEVTERAIEWLAQRGPGKEQDNKRWFLFAHYFDAHSPYESAPEQSVRFASPYDAEIASVDAEIGRLVTYARAMPGRTLVVITADHGESLGEHGESEHNRFVYEATNRVPLVMVLEGAIPAAKRLATPVGHVDLFPTLLEFLALRRPEHADGISLAPALRRGAEPERRPQYLETLVWSLENRHGIEVRAVLDGTYKLIETKGAAQTVAVELYDLANDPGELNNRAVSEPDLRRLLQERLGLWSERLEKNGVPSRATLLDKGAVERLQSLGYL